MDDLHQFTLPGGIRVAHIRSNNPVAHCGLYIRCGSRDEQAHEQGLAHFVEHMLFKGTQHRKPYHILSRLDSVGGEINAFTAKEDTCIYASFLRPYFPRAVDLIFDIAFHSTFPEREMRVERDVVLEEIASYKDNPAEQIFDDFEEMIFAGHPIGRNSLGTPESVQRFTRKDILAFIHRGYRPEDMVFVSVGDVSVKRLERMLLKALPEWGENGMPNHRQPMTKYVPSTLALEDHSHQTHLILGSRAYNVHHPLSMAFSLVNNVLGGPGLNSRLNLNIREKHGFAYHLESYYNAYSDGGLFGVYVGTDRKHIAQSVRLIERELKLLRDKKMGDLQLHRAKKQWLGQQYLQQDNHLNKMLNLGKALLMNIPLESWSDLEKRLDAIDASTVLEVANEVFDPQLLSRIMYLERNEEVV
jgi:predicted Zn-dependent peptidase